MVIDDFAVVCGLPAVLYFLFPKQVIVQLGCCKCTRYRAGSMLSGCMVLSGCDGAERLQWSSIKTILILSKGFQLSVVFACSLSCLLLGQSQYTIFSQPTSVAQFSPNRRQLLIFF